MELYFQDGESGEMPDVGVGPGNRGRPSHVKRAAYGEESSIAISVRNNGHHSKPHTHDREQLNYIVDGEMWFFIEDRPYCMRTGDILRIPRDAVHWSWVRSDEPCTCIEVFSPPNPKNGQALFDPSETPNIRESKQGSHAVDLATLGFDLAEVEARPPVNRRP